MATTAFIETIADKLRHVASRGSDRDALMTLAEFFDRCDFVEDGFLLHPESCTDIKLESDGFVISFGETHIRFKKTIGRWAVSDSPVTHVHPSHSHDGAVFATGAPFSFLQGIAFAFDCMGSMGKDLNYYRHKAYSAVAVAAECEARHDFLVKEIPKGIAAFRDISQCVQREREEFARKTFAKMARDRCVVSLDGCTDMPEPPSDTVKFTAAKAALKGVGGIYFLWNGGRVEYVGRADDISKRLSGHGIAKEHHYVSAIEMSVPDSWIHEPYYIWLCRPPLNGNVRTADRIRCAGARTSRIGVTQRQREDGSGRVKEAS